MNGWKTMRMNKSYRTWKLEAKTYYIVSRMHFSPLLIGGPANHTSRSIGDWVRKHAN